MKPIKLSITKLVDLLVQPKEILHPTIQYIPKEILDEGRTLHWKLGFAEGKNYSRFYEYKNCLFEILGSPDRVREGTVEELKTYRSKETRKLQLNRAKYQLMLYCFLTGTEKACLYLYDAENKVMETFGDFDVPDWKQKQILEMALDKYLKIREAIEI